MASKGIVINFLSDVRDFLRGTGDVEEALDDVVDSLEDVSKEGDQAAEKLADSFKDNMKEVSRAAREAGDGIGTDMRKGTKRAEEGMQNFREEANSTAKESAASFDGSAESIIDSFQEIAANAFGGFGAAAQIAGLAAAAGIGIASASILNAEEEAQKATDRVGELGQAMIDAGAAGERPLQTVVDSLTEIVSNGDDAVKKFKDISRAAQFVGTDAEDMALAYAGQADALDGQLDILDDLIAKEEEVLDVQAKNGSRFGAIQEGKVNTLKQQQEELQKVQEETEAAAAIEEAYLAAGGAEAQAKADAIGTINAAYDDVVGSILDYKDEETGLLDTQAFIDAIQARKDQLASYQTDLASMGLTTEQKSALDDMGIEAASAYLEGIKSGTPEQSKFLKDSLTEAAKDSSGVAKKEIEKAFEKPTKAKVEAVADTEAAEKTLDALIKNRTAKIQVKYVDRYGKEVP